MLRTVGKSTWHRGVWMTPPALALGLVAGIAGFIDPPIVHTPVMMLIGVAAIGLGVASLGSILWRIERRSRRLRNRGFWLSLAADCVLIVTLAMVYHRAAGRSATIEEHHPQLQDTAQAPDDLR